MKKNDLFLLIGCGGNDNRFSTIESCVNTCGGNDIGVPSKTTDICASVKCDQAKNDLQLAKGCIPNTKPGECCPSSWDCSRWEERLTRLDECFFVSDKFPRGKFYAVEEPIPESDHGCLQGGHCLPNGEIIFASLSCFWPPEADDCVEIRDTPSQCCPGFKCGADKPQRLAQCTFEGRNYTEGQVMTSAFDPCYSCVCKDNFNEGEHCEQSRCTFKHDMAKMVKGCVPVYNEPRRSCCDVKTWICPEEQSTKEILILEIDPPMSDFDDAPPPAEGDGGDQLIDYGGLVPEIPPPEVLLPTPMIVCPPGVEFNPNYLERNPRPLDAITPNPADRQIRVPREKNSDDCILPPAIEGPCMGFEERYFFDMATRKCVAFQYGGFNFLNSGHNVFESEDKCADLCHEFLVEDKTVSEKEELCNDEDDSAESSEEDDEDDERFSAGELCLPFRQKFKYNSDKNQCEGFYTGLCNAGPNRFNTIGECQSTCVNSNTGLRSALLTQNFKEESNPICNYEVVTGNCRGRKRRYHYDSYTGECKLFYYSGCDGNENNFLSLSECVHACPAAKARVQTFQPLQLRSLLTLDPCDQELNLGTCRALVPSYYYDKASQTCKFFFYGGCEGNDNRFGKSNFFHCALSKKTILLTRLIFLLLVI